MSTQKPHESYLDKQQAATHTGLSVRRILELAARGKIRRHYSDDPATRRRVAVFAKSDLDKAKAGEFRYQNMPTAIEKMRKSRSGDALQHSIAPSFKGELIRLLEEKVKELAPEVGDRIFISHAGWMTLEEADAYIKLPQGFLVILIKSGKLKALDVGPRPGGRWRVHRADLDAIRGELQMQVTGSSEVLRQPGA